VAGEDVEQLSAGRIPQLNAGVAAGGGHILAIRRERDALDCVGQAGKDAQSLSGGGIPQICQLVGSAGQQGFAVGRECDRRQAGVSGHVDALVAARPIPDLRGSIGIARRDQAAVRRKGDPGYRRAVVVEIFDGLAARKIPEINRRIGVDGQQRAVVWSEGQLENAVGRGRQLAAHFAGGDIPDHDRVRAAGDRQLFAVRGNGDVFQAAWLATKRAPGVIERQRM
jgi:hypothetical protein